MPTPQKVVEDALAEFGRGRRCKKSKTITSVDDLENFDKLPPRDQARVRELVRRHNAERAGRARANPVVERRPRPAPAPPPDSAPRRSGRTAPRDYTKNGWTTTDFDGT